jgi:hypothetical protein
VNYKKDLSFLVSLLGPKKIFNLYYYKEKLLMSLSPSGENETNPKPHRSRRNRPSKKERRRCHSKGIYKNIQCIEDLIRYFKNERNPYNDFMVLCLERQSSAAVRTQTLRDYQQIYGIKHHAIPLFENGPDES